MKKPEQYYRETADELGLDLKDVKQVNQFFWKVGIKEEAKSVKHTALYIKNIGTIVVSKYKLYDDIKLLISKIRGVAKSEKFNDDRKKLFIDLYKAKLKTLLRKRNELIKEGLYDR